MRDAFTTSNWAPPSPPPPPSHTKHARAHIYIYIQSFTARNPPERRAPRAGGHGVDFHWGPAEAQQGRRGRVVGDEAGGVGVWGRAVCVCGFVRCMIKGQQRS